ncbi:hypothetical protein AAE478_010273 [Parahypoxylon ruwenzoriense]
MSEAEARVYPLVGLDISASLATALSTRKPRIACRAFKDLNLLILRLVNAPTIAFLKESLGVMSPRIRDMCLSILRNVPDLNRENAFRSHHGTDSWFRPVARLLHQSLCETFGQYLGTDRPTSKLEELARIICINTSRPFSDDESDTEKWIGQFSEENLRWESLGLLSVFWNFAPRSDGAVAWSKCSAEFDVGFLISRENLRLCLELCKEFSAANSIMLCMSQRCTVVNSMFAGDAHLLGWRLHAEAMSLVTFLGLHAVEDTDQHQGSLASEIKKRQFSYLYTMDMVVVAFTGRPPLISRRFASTPLPLDISDEDLFSKEGFAKAVERLDEKGWNTDGIIHISSRIRARTLIAIIREELFEIALSHKPTASIDVLLYVNRSEAMMLRFTFIINIDTVNSEPENYKRSLISLPGYNTIH